MPELYRESKFDKPLCPADVLAMAHDGAGCFALHRVDWLASLLSRDGRRMVCRFRAADAESVRIALRTIGADSRRLWPGTVHDRPDLGDAERGSANVLVRRGFAQPVTLDEIQALEDAGAWCLDARDVRFIRSFFSVDRKRMVCLYRAPDAEAVRQAQRQAGMPVEDVWAFRTVAM